MPQFTYDAKNPDAVYTDTATGGKGKRTKLWQGAAGDGTVSKQDDGGGGGGGTPSAPATTGKTAAERAAERRAAAKKRREERAAARAAAEAAKRNPLTAPFKTPAELRKDAAELAAMGVAGEDALRATAAQQQAGLGGLTSALTGTLTGIADRTQASLAGFGNLYSQLAGQAQSAGQSAAAAAGAPTSIAPGASPTMASNLANLSAPTMGYAPAAAVTGAQMVGAVTANLTKALMDRSSKLSADTAKYLYQLRNDEIQRAISQGTLAQNEARLGLTAENQAWDRQVDTARISQGWQRLAQSAANAGAKAGKDKAKAIRNTKAQILADLDQWTGATVPTGKFEYTVFFTDPIDGLKKLPKTFVAMSEAEAIEQAKSSVPENRVDTISAEKGEEQLGQPTAQQIIRQISAQLVNQGMSRRNAQAWVRKFVLAPAGLNVNTSGAFMGGVGGSVT